MKKSLKCLIAATASVVSTGAIAATNMENPLYMPQNREVYLKKVPVDKQSFLYGVSLAILDTVSQTDWMFTDILVIHAITKLTEKVCTADVSV